MFVPDAVSPLPPMETAAENNNTQCKYESENCGKYGFLAFHGKYSFDFICGFPSRNISISKQSSPFTAKTLENCHKTVRIENRA